jgi:hypothetical protein
MHPYVSSRVSQEHQADLRRAADQNRLAAQAAGHETAARRPAGISPAAIRNRAGWTLVHLGLRLVSSSDG